MRIGRTSLLATLAVTLSAPEQHVLLYTGRSGTTSKLVYIAIEEFGLLDGLFDRPIHNLVKNKSGSLVPLREHLAEVANYPKLLERWEQS